MLEEIQSPTQLIIDTSLAIEPLVADPIAVLSDPQDAIIKKVETRTILETHPNVQAVGLGGLFVSKKDLRSLKNHQDYEARKADRVQAAGASGLFVDKAALKAFKNNKS